MPIQEIILQGFATLPWEINLKYIHTYIYINTYIYIYICIYIYLCNWLTGLLYIEYEKKEVLKMKRTILYKRKEKFSI